MIAFKFTPCSLSGALRGETAADSRDDANGANQPNESNRTYDEL